MKFANNTNLSIKVQLYKAFTLAEVLITLGIIGIVAAMTIPSLMKSYQEFQYKQAAKEAYSKLSQAMLQMKVEEGSGFSRYYTSGNPYTFKPALIKYFKVLKDCGNEGCVVSSTSSDIYKTLTGYGGDTQNMGNDGQFVTTDGMFFNIQQSAAVNQPLAIVVDVNGYIKKPNVFGKDTFAFQLINDQLVPMGAPSSFLPANNYCQKIGSYISSLYQGLGCMYYVMQEVNY